jgi:spermidine dehydrogenase
MDSSITRRDFLGSTLLGAGAALFDGLTPAQILAASAENDWTGYGGIGDYRYSNGNTLEVLQAGHKLRDGAYSSLLADPIDTGEIYDCVVANTDLAGAMDHRYSILEAHRAVGQIVDQVLTS